MTTAFPASLTHPQVLSSSHSHHSHLSRLWRWQRSAASLGMTLLEAMIALFVVAILAALAVPQMQAFVTDTQLSTSVNHFIAANAFARAEAINRGKLVTICRSVNADIGNDTCSDAAGNGHAGNDWGAGWLVFIEASVDASKIGVVDGDDEILARQAALPSHFQGSSSIRKITYNANGQPINLAGANLLFHSDGKYKRMLCIARSGRLRVVRDVDHCAQG